MKTNAGWRKYRGNPVLGGDLGTCFDVCVLKEAGVYRMWFSWRPRQSIGLTQSRDGIRWTEPVVVLEPAPSSGWEAQVNRVIVVKRRDGYHMWYTGQAGGQSRIGYATGPNGVRWRRAQREPVLAPEQDWERVAVMCPHVLWDEDGKRFRMWYSGGEQYEPDAIGYATSSDGIAWRKHPGNPIFTADPGSAWEPCKVTACQVLPCGERYVMCYIGFQTPHTARIGLARSRDGITGWERHPANPILAPDPGAWDGDACYKPFALYEEQTDRWLLWYNGRNKQVAAKEQIGLAIHDGRELWA
ncbi:MAG: hypothetical protein JXR37_33645 [Kiritimatiellae bacterium]|nr:hypothetical protein [Kiritimatiellia bacterium]